MADLKKSLGMMQGMGILVSALLGTGVFIVPELTVTNFGSHALWGWGLLLIAVLPIAITFAELGKRFPSAAGASNFVRVAFGVRQGGIVGWLFLALLPVGLSAAMEMAIWFLRSLTEIGQHQALVAKLIILGLIGWANLREIKFSGNLQTAIAYSVGIIIVVLTGLAGIGWFPATENQASSPDWPKVGAAAALAFWSFIGIEVMAHLSSEFKNPDRDLPIALIGGTLIVGGIYWAGSWLIYYFVAPDGNSTIAIVQLTQQLLGSYGNAFICIFGLLSCIATMNIYLASAARMVWQMANDRRLPNRLRSLNDAGAPDNAIYSWMIISAVSICLTSGFGMKLEGLITAANGVIVLIYLMTMLAAMKLLPRLQKRIAIAGLLVCVVLAISLYKSMIYAIVIYFSLSVVYLITRVPAIRSLSLLQFKREESRAKQKCKSAA